jgi:short-subunit dehydrogenase
MARKWAIITGAGSGIGEEFAVQLSDMGYSMILIGRTTEKLEAVKKKLHKRQKAYNRHHEARNQQVRIIAKDLSDMTAAQTAIDMTAQIIDAEKGVPAILINSAGFGSVGEFMESDIDMQERMVDVNVKALTLFTYRMITMMDRSGGGRILNVASSAGLFPGGPYMAVYYATKSYVVSFTNGVRRELTERGSRVRVASLCPGPVNTPFNIRAGVRNALRGISPRRCVKSAIRGMKHDRAVIVPGVSIKLAAFGAKVLPAGLMIPIVSHQQKRKL